MTDYYRTLLNRQIDNKYNMRSTTSIYRLDKLSRVRKEILSRKQEILEALRQDFNKPFIESDLTEILPIISMINVIEKKLKSWMKKEKVKSSILFGGTKSWVKKEGKGNCLILCPWNYPFQLNMYPTLTAFAAGNTCIVKPSEFTPNTNRIVSSIYRNIFTEEEVYVCEGGIETSTALLELPFDHIFFTGSSSVGKIVMKAASKNLTSVTLELGGKSPVFVDRTCDFENAAEKIIWGKYINSGQTCVAPDYVLVHIDDQDKLVLLMKEYLENFHGDNELCDRNFSSIITQSHFERQKNLFSNAVELGAKVAVGGKSDEEKHSFEPTILTGVSLSSIIMEQEIFGPILPVITYETKKEAMDFINNRDNALALYLFTTSIKSVDMFVDGTSAGGVTVNDMLIAVGHPYLPFGGSGGSGIGQYHGKYGFEEFSNLKSILKRSRNTGLSYFYPPYTERKQKILNIFLEKMPSIF